MFKYHNRDSTYEFIQNLGAIMEKRAKNGKAGHRRSPPVSSGSVPGQFRGGFRAISGQFRGGFRADPGRFQGSFGAVPEQFRGCSGAVSGRFRGGFRAVMGQFSSGSGV